MTIDLDAIEKAAREALLDMPGEPWHDVCFLLDVHHHANSDAHYIATMDPQTTLALVERVRGLEAIIREGARKAGSYDEWCMSWSWMEGQAAKLRVSQ